MQLLMKKINESNEKMKDIKERINRKKYNII